MKKKLDFNIELKNLNQTSLLEGDKPIIIAKSLALSLAQTTKGDAVKFYGWGVELVKDGVLELDLSDLELLKTTVNSFEISSLVKAQFLMIINAAQ